VEPAPSSVALTDVDPVVAVVVAVVLLLEPHAASASAAVTARAPALMR
jgi:hypothetical protein